MKIILTAVLFLTCIAAIAKTGNKKKIPATNATPAKTIYDFKVKSLEGGTIDFSQYKGKKILIVNTASKCGFTPQYAGLEKLYEPFDLRILIQKIIDSDISTILHSRVLPYYRNEQAGYHFHQSKIY